MIGPRKHVPNDTIKIFASPQQYYARPQPLSIIIRSTFDKYMDETKKFLYDERGIDAAVWSREKYS